MSKKTANPKFQARHHEAIAQILRDIKLNHNAHTHDESIEIDTLVRITNELDKLFRADNSAYSSERFLMRAGWQAVNAEVVDDG